jgi:hypothetical protein
MVPCPWPVAASEPYRSTRSDATSSNLPDALSSSENTAAARMGPTVCELDGPIPMEKRSKTPTAIINPN